MTRILNDGKLHAKAKTKERYFMLSCIFDSRDLAVNSTITKSTRNKDSLYTAKNFVYVLFVEFLRIYPFDIYSRMLENSTMF